MGIGLAVCAAALAASALTFFTGFGLGTLLMPVFALFFPVEKAVALTALVHFANNAAKLGMMGKYADKDAMLRFGLPAVAAAFLGAWLLLRLDASAKPAIGAVMMLFAAAELSLKGRSFDRKWLPLGGILSGFFGGLSGHQGALRSAFLIRLGLSKEAFIGTGVAIACMVDATRLAIYGKTLEQAGEHAGLLAVAGLSAFAGALLGKRLLHKVTIAALERGVAALLFVLGAAMALGCI